MRHLSPFFVLILAGATGAAAQGVTPWGDPDLQGTWMTANFNDQRLFRGATGQLHLVERFTIRDADTIDYRLTVIDPATFTHAWTIENALRRGRR